MRSLFAIILLSFYFTISASTSKELVRTNHDNQPQLESDTQIFSLKGKGEPHPVLERRVENLLSIIKTKNRGPTVGSELRGYMCGNTLYTMEYLRRSAVPPSSRGFIKKARQEYPVEMYRGVYRYPLMQDQRRVWKEGDPVGLHHVVYNTKNRIIYAITIKPTKGGDENSEKFMAQCEKVPITGPHSPISSPELRRLGRFGTNDPIITPSLNRFEGAANDNVAKAPELRRLNRIGNNDPIKLQGFSRFEDTGANI